MPSLPRTPTPDCNHQGPRVASKQEPIPSPARPPLVAHADQQTREPVSSEVLCTHGSYHACDLRTRWRLFRRRGVSRLKIDIFEGRCLCEHLGEEDPCSTRVAAVSFGWFWRRAACWARSRAAMTRPREKTTGHSPEPAAEPARGREWAATPPEPARGARVDRRSQGAMRASRVAAWMGNASARMRARIRRADRRRTAAPRARMGMAPGAEVEVRAEPGAQAEPEVRAAPGAEPQVPAAQGELRGTPAAVARRARSGPSRPVRRRRRHPARTV